MAKDLARIDRNMKRLIEQNAPDEDLQSYLDSEGVTAQEVTNYKPTSAVGMAVDFVDRTARRIGDAVRGPKNKEDLPNIYDELHKQNRLDPAIDAANIGAFGMPSDEGMADIFQENLGSRFVSREADKNGYPIITYLDDQGNKKRAYVNQPGLDMQDVGRAVRGALPFGIVGGGAGMALRGAGSLMRFGVQGGLASATSIGQDQLAETQGSQQGTDLGKAAMMGLMGGAAEVLPLPVFAGGTGAAAGVMSDGTADERAVDALGYGVGGLLAGRGITRALEKNPMRHVQDGKLASKDAIAKARSAGLNPDELDPASVEMFARGIDNLADPNEVAAMIQTNRFGIPTTKATRTKDPKLSAIEKDIRAGNLGDEAKLILDEFDKRQQQELMQSALRRPPASQEVALARETGVKGDPYTEGMGAMVAPTRMATKPDELWPSDMGGDIASGLKSAKQAADDKISEAWKKAGDFEALKEAFDTLPGFLETNLGRMRLTPATTPTAMRMEADLADYVSGKGIAAEGPKLIRQTPLRTVEDMRRHLLDAYQGAPPGSPDFRAAKNIYDGFNDWMDDIVEKQLIAGNAEEAVAARTARELTRDLKQLFKPAGRGEEAKIIQKIIDSEATPDSVISDLLGGGGPTVAPRPASIKALIQIKEILNPKRKLVDEKTSMRVWNDIRMAYWSRLVMNKKGQMHTPDMAANNIQAAIRHQSGLMQRIFDQNEIGTMQQYAKALKVASFKDPNPSGTATALRGLIKNENDSWLKTFLQTQSKRELFSKHNVVMSRIYQVLAKKVPASLFGSREIAGTMAARRSVSQSPTSAPPVRFSPVGTIGYQQYGNQR